MSDPLTEEEGRAAVVRVAMEYEGTKYHHQGMIKGVGVDCATLIICVFEEAGVVATSEIAPWLPQWFLHKGEEKYLNEVRKYATEITEAEAQIGDIVVYKMGRTFSHGAIIIEPGWPTILHAVQDAGMVIRDIGNSSRFRDRESKFFTCWKP